MSEKKLIILDIEKEISPEKENFLSNNLANILEENIVIFNFPNPDKRKKFFKDLKKSSETKEFNLQTEDEIYSFISKKYAWKIENNAINLIIKYKWANIEKIESEIEKLLILKDIIKKEDIIENITPELEESIFQLIDDILNLRKTEAIKKIDIILNDTNVYLFYNNLLANLRANLYIMKLKTSPLTPLLKREGNRTSNISKVLDLKNRSFLASKNYKINYKELEKFYIQIANIDKKMKSWKLLWSEDKDLKLEIEKGILGI